MRFTIAVTLFGLLASATPVRRENITITTTAQATITYIAHVMVTDHITVTDHTTRTVTQTAYIIEDLPLPCGADVKGNPVTTAQPAAYTPSADTALTKAPQPMPSALLTASPTRLSTFKTSYPTRFCRCQHHLPIPTVILDQSGYVLEIECNVKGLKVSFSEDKAYAFAKANWQTPFLLVTDDVRCFAADAEGIQVFWLVNDLSYDDQGYVVVVSAEEIAVKDAYNKVSLVWGTYTPNGSKPGGTNWGGSPSNTPGGALGGGNWGGGGSPWNNSSRQLG